MNTVAQVRMSTGHLSMKTLVSTLCICKYSFPNISILIFFHRNLFFKCQTKSEVSSSLFSPSSDQMGNKGAFITLARDLKPQFTTYEAVVSHYIIITSSPITSFPTATPKEKAYAVCKPFIWPFIIIPAIFFSVFVKMS